MGASIEPPKLYGDHPIFANATLEWVTSEPGVHLRLAKWQGGDRGSVHIFNGRTEYIEKYADFIAALIARGFHVSVHDWRGQGLSTRNKRHPQRCHVDDFEEFQRDANAIMQACKDMPSPRHLFCHSMGGAIGLRYLHNTNKISSAVFSAPMWGINVPIVLRPFVPMIIKRVKNHELEWNCVPGTSEKQYEFSTGFWRNMLTTSRTQYQKLRANIENFPELGIGGPTFYWYFAALREMDALMNMQAPSTPALVFVGDKEKTVSKDRIQEYTERSENYRLVPLPSAKHEAYIERAEIRKTLWDHIDSFWLTE